MREDLANFPGLRSGRRRSNVVDHLTILGALAITLVTFHLSDDPDTGKGSVSDGLGVALTFLAVAYYVGWLPSLWEKSRGTWLASLVLPTLIILVTPYFYFTFLAYHIQPTATVTVFFVHLLVLTYMSCRI